MGADNWIAVLSADHGVCPLPEIAKRIIADHFTPGGKAPDQPFKLTAMPTLKPGRKLLDHAGTISADVALHVRTSAAAGSDDLADTVDYGQVANSVHALIVGEPVDLIETLAERIADACLGFPGVERVKVTVHKPHAPIEVPFDDVELRIVREQSGDA